jgi:general L-amino acid transport system substrate-binding protein
MSYIQQCHSTKPYFARAVSAAILVFGVNFLILSHAWAVANVASATQKKVLADKSLRCGVAGNLPGFSFVDGAGDMRGIDADICRAIAASLGVKVTFKSLNAKTRFPALQSGEVDVLVRNTTQTLSRDVSLGFDFVGINYYDGQGFMVKKALGVKSAKELAGASVCVQTGTTTELNLNDYFARNNLKFKAVVFETLEDAVKAYESGRCDAYTTDASGLAATRSALKNPTEHVILPELISKEPLGPLVRHGDNEWADLVRWVFNALVTAEEKGITKANVKEMKKKSADPEVKRLLGESGSIGESLGLDNDWAVRAIAEVGNYGEIFDRNLGPQTPLAIERGLNALWNQGGLLYSPPFN